MAQTLMRDEIEGNGTEHDVAGAQNAPRRSGRGVERAAVVASLVTSIAFIARSAFTLDGKVAFTLFDDAMISLTYARNLARGGGLVWNQGGEHVEGYTNFLWTLWMAAIHAVGVPDRLTSLVVMITGALLLAGTVVLTARIARHAASETAVAGIAAWMVALSPPLIFWTLRGMEVGLLACLVAAAVLLIIRIEVEASGARLSALALVLAAGVLTRTDFAVLALVLACFATWWANRSRRAMVVLATLGTVVATLIAHTAFRLLYYGAATPNTYTLKIGGIALTDRLDRGLTVMTDLVGVELVVPLVIVAIGFLVHRARPSRLEQLAGSLLLASFAYVVWTGGDAWEWMTMPNRYVAPLIPQLALLVGLAVVKIVRAPRPASAKITLSVAAAVVLLVVTVALPSSDSGRQLVGGTFLGVAAITGLVGLVAIGIVLLTWDRSRRFGAAAIGAIVVVTLFAMPAIQWLRINASYLDADQHNSRLGANLAAVTAPDAVIAVVSAGAITYFADRPAVDLLGKSDVKVANEAPRNVPFVPGHVKFDYAWSLGALRPDLVTAYYGDAEDARAELHRFGYQQVHGNVFVLSTSEAVDVDALSERLAVEPAEHVPASTR